MSDRKPEPLVNGKALSSLRVVDLKQELEKRGISKSGSKKDLVDRLRTVSRRLRAAPRSPSPIPVVSCAAPPAADPGDGHGRLAAANESR